MDTQIVLLLLALRSISAYTLVQVQDQKSTRNPQERPTLADGSLRHFTNSHACYQFPGWELDSLEHLEPREDDKAIDKIITNSDTSNDDADCDTDEHDQIDKLDDIPQPKEPKNQMFDEVKEKYQKHYPHRFIKRIEAESIGKNRRRRQSNYYQPLANNPVLRDEFGNILHDNMNAVFSDGHFANVPRAYGMNQRNDYIYSYNHINNMPNEPIYNPYTQTIQQRPVEIQTVNNYAYKTVQQSPQEVEPINVMPIYKQPTNEAMYNQLFSQPLQQKQVETQTLNTYKREQESPHEIALTNNNKPMYSQPINEAMYNQLISQQVQQKAVDTQTSYKPIQQSPQEVDLANGQSVYSQPTNEAIFNQHIISQSVQQKPVEAKTLNNNLYKTEQQSPQEAKITNKSMLPIPEKTETDNINKLHQTAQEVPKQNTIKNITQIFEKETSKNNVDVNRNVRNNEDMKNNVNQMSKKIGSIKEKVKDRFAAANLSGILTSPGGRKLLQSYGIIPTGKEDISKNITGRLTEAMQSNPDHVSIDEKSEHLNNNTATKDISDINNKSIEVFAGTDLLIKKQTENSANNSVNLNTENQNNNDSALNQVDLKNIPKPLSIEMLDTTKTSTALDETKSTEENLEVSEPRVSAETFNNGTAIVETQEQTYTNVTRVNHIIESADTDVTAHDENEENNENKERYDPKIADVKKSEILNLDKLFDRDEFWEWLSNWTTTYMEIVNEKIEALVKVEVAKQMKDLYLVTKTELMESCEQRENNTDKVEVGNEQEIKEDSIIGNV